MRLSFLIISLSCCHHVLMQLALADEISVTRHPDGDVFTIPGSCNEACMVLSSGTASPYSSASSVFAGRFDDSCTCQCNFGFPVFREDLRICVDVIKECEGAGFVNSSGLVEQVPYVFLPRYGQIVYPSAEIQFEGIDDPVCIITGVQQLGHTSWSDLRNVSDIEFPFRLHTIEQRTFLQWTGDARLHETAEGKIVVVKFACRESYPATGYEVFTPCVSFRVAGSPKSSIKEVSFVPSPPRQQGLSYGEYAAIGLTSVLLALVYVAGVSLCLRFRSSGQQRRRRHHHKSRSRSAGNSSGSRTSYDRDGDDDEDDNDEEEYEAKSRGGRLDGSLDVEAGIVKCNPLLSLQARSRRFDANDVDRAVVEAELLADKLLGHGVGGRNSGERENELDNVTSAIIHPHGKDYSSGGGGSESQEQSCNSGSSMGAERLPEEDVRVIETTDNGNGQQNPVFPGTQRRKLYFNPAYFERQLLMAPPPAAIEFLFKIREVISIAKHKMAAKRFVPTLNEIPEEASSTERQSKQATAATKSVNKKRSSSVQGNSSSNNNRRKSLRCTGCAGCTHGSSTPNLPTARGLATPISGESRVRAWLEDVKLLDSRWRSLDDDVHAMTKQQQQLQFNRGTSRDFDAESARLSSKSLPPIFREMPQRRLNGNCVNGAFEDDEEEEDDSRGRYDLRKSARSPRRDQEEEDSIVNANVRRAIENSFKKQLELLRSQQQKDSTRPARNGGDEVKVVDDSKRNLMKNQMNCNGNDNNNNNKANDIEETRVLLNIINDELSVRSSSDAKRIMDAVIRELVITKEMEREKLSSTKASDYETDSLEKTKVSRRSSSSPVSTEKSSPPQSGTALPVNEELTMRNAIIDVQISETTSSVVKNHNLPEVVPLRPENYALVSEVYVNNGYTSPAGSDEDSGPEIQYEPENPGHLTIKVVDSPVNYTKQDESEYEPDTLDRKPMRLKINDEPDPDQRVLVKDEVYVDSLERTSQILLRSKQSFREENGANVESSPKPPREYSSLREIYEARLKYQQQQQQMLQQQQTMTTRSVQATQKAQQTDRSKAATNGYGKQCASPLPTSRHERRQRKADNPPDVVPKPPPPPPPPEPAVDNRFAKNARGRSFAKTGDPTTCEVAPAAHGEVARAVGKTNTIAENNDNNDSFTKKIQENKVTVKQTTHSATCPKRAARRRDKAAGLVPASLEDSAYVSSPESNGSRRRLLEQGRELEDVQANCTSNDKNSYSTESSDGGGGGGACNSESGAESVETDSVFFGNFRAERDRLDFQAKSRVY